MTWLLTAITLTIANPVAAYTGPVVAPVLAQPDPVSNGAAQGSAGSPASGGSAQGTAPGATNGQQRPQQGPSMAMNLIVFGGIFLIFWLFIIRPQSKQRKAHEKLVASLKKGDAVITNSGIFGRITGFDDEKNAVILEIAKNVNIRVVRAHVGAIQNSGQVPEPTNS